MEIKVFLLQQYIHSFLAFFPCNWLVSSVTLSTTRGSHAIFFTVALNPQLLPPRSPSFWPSAAHWYPWPVCLQASNAPLVHVVKDRLLKTVPIVSAGNIVSSWAVVLPRHIKWLRLPSWLLHLSTYPFRCHSISSLRTLPPHYLLPNSISCPSSPIIQQPIPSKQCSLCTPKSLICNTSLPSVHWGDSWTTGESSSVRPSWSRTQGQCSESKAKHHAV